ncbi:hypothetical protein BJ508DRAFT_326183 [Ascobolus immersus RN42]|uniref:Uncharacterized protein n=1 Tax=Ascobolus immersus RN42 TaxID=1160509 RepID=A0A3N4IJB2_ASCIM|nr:hypothetical protein BJ508DRAFT_326183 [Ascobolus immersus RN42]
MLTLGCEQDCKADCSQFWILFIWMIQMIVDLNALESDLLLFLRNGPISTDLESLISAPQQATDTSLPGTQATEGVAIPPLNTDAATSEPPASNPPATNPPASTEVSLNTEESTGITTGVKSSPTSSTRSRASARATCPGLHVLLHQYLN